MIININYKTSYNFTSEVPRLVQQLKLSPTECINQKIIKWSIEASEGEIVESHKDCLGNQINNIYLQNLIKKQIITTKGIIHTKNTFGVMKGLHETVHPDCFLRQTILTKPNKKIISLINKKSKAKTNSIEFCHTMNTVVGDSIKYLSGSTDIKTDAQHAISLGTGVCQDFAHILISLARHNDYPARYVNGFLAGDSGHGDNDTHAWVEIFIKDLGWVGFDPSHKCSIDDKYVRMGCGFDFADASMIKGVKSNFKGEETLDKEINIQLQGSQ